MNAILKHETRWAAALAVLGTAIHSVILLDEPVATQWVMPEDNYLQISVGFHIAAATLLALFAVLGDDLLRTREYLRHRPVSPARLFWGRHLLGLAVVSCWLVLVPALSLGRALLFDEDAPLVEAGRYWRYLLQGLPALLYYAVAVFAATATRGVLQAIVFTSLAVGAAATLVGVSQLLATVDYTAALAIVSVALTPIFLIAAQICWDRGRDRDRPWDGRQLRVAGAPLLLVTTAAAALACTFLFVGASEELLSEYPAVASDGQQFALAAWSRRDQALHRLGPDHRSRGRLPETWDMVWSPNRGRWNDAFDARDVAVVAAKRRVFSDLNRRLNGYLGADGPLMLYRTARFDGQGKDRPWKQPVEKTGVDPGGSTGFSADTAVLTPRFAPVLALGDPADGGVWLWDTRSEPARFVRQPLPGGDRFVGVVPDPELYVWWGTAARSRKVAFFARGERGVYLWEEAESGKAGSQPGGQFRIAPEERLPVTPQSVLNAERAISGVVGLKVVLRKPGGGVVFEHDYQPRQLDERLFAVGAQAATVLRPPLSALTSLWASPTRVWIVGPRLLLDPGVALGYRWPLLANVLVAVALSLLAFFRLRRLGVPTPRRLFWTTAILLGGPGAYLTHRLVETTRAWKPMPGEAAPAPVRPLLLADQPTSL